MYGQSSSVAILVAACPLPPVFWDLQLLSHHPLLHSHVHQFEPPEPLMGQDKVKD